MGFIRTVLGDIDPAELGYCYAHEHIIIDNPFIAQKYPDFVLDSVARAVEELKQFYRHGGRAMVDSMPCGCGRNISKLTGVSLRSGVHIVAPTGIHLAQYYPEDHWSGSIGVEKLCALMIGDIEEGIDVHDYNGDKIERAPHRAGVIKVATSGERFNARELRVFEAAAQAHRYTGCPILTHTEQGKGGILQVEFLEKQGVDLGHVVISHTDRNPDFGYHREMLQSGVCLEYDSAFRWKTGQQNVTLQLLLELLPEFPHQLMLGMDAARRQYWESYGGYPGLCFLLDTFSKRLCAEGISEGMLDLIFKDNPASAYAMHVGEEIE